MPSHRLHIKWEKKLGLLSDKKLHGIVDNLTHHDARGIKIINPHTPYLPFIIEDLPKNIVERHKIVISGLHSIFEDLREHYGSFLPKDVLKRVALHLILDGIADVIQKDLGLEGLKKNTPEKIVDMGYRRIYKKMSCKGRPAIRDPQERLFFEIAGEMVQILEIHSAEIVKDIVEDLKANGRLRPVGYERAYGVVSKAMRELEPYLNYPPSFNLESLIRQVASYLSRGIEVEVPIMWRKQSNGGFEIIKAKTLDEFLQKFEEFKKRIGIN